jgi:hypothetical protein
MLLEQLVADWEVGLSVGSQALALAGLWAVAQVS